MGLALEAMASIHSAPAAVASKSKLGACASRGHGPRTCTRFQPLPRAAGRPRARVRARGAGQAPRPSAGDAFGSCVSRNSPAFDERLRERRAPWRPAGRRAPAVPGRGSPRGADATARRCTASSVSRRLTRLMDLDDDTATVVEVGRRQPHHARGPKQRLGDAAAPSSSRQNPSTAASMAAPSRVPKTSSSTLPPRYSPPPAASVCVRAASSGPMWSTLGRTRSVPGVRPRADSGPEQKSAGPYPGPKRLTCEVETAGIEPASAVACKTASTSVAGALDLVSRSPRRRGCGKPA